MSEREREALAARIQVEMNEESRSTAALDDPHDLVLDQLIAEAKDEIARGGARDLNESL